MRAWYRLGIGAGVITLTLAVPVSVDAAPPAAVVSSTAAESVPSVVLTPEEDTAPASSESDSSPLRPVLGFVLIAIVFVVGLRAVKRQRDEGRRSKLPPIG